MARIRTIKPGFFHDLGMAGLPIPTRLTYVGLWTYVDDSGRGVDDARLVKADVWPLDDNYTTRKVEKDLAMLADADRICRYESEGRRYLHIVRWDHQRINRPQRSLIPHCAFTEHSLKAHCANSERSSNDHGTITEDSLREGKGRERNPKAPPSGAERNGGQPPAGDAEAPPPLANGNLAAATQKRRSQGTNPRTLGTNPRAVAEQLAAEKARLAVAVNQARSTNPCPKCDGNGNVEARGFASPCPDCDGSGVES